MDSSAPLSLTVAEAQATLRRLVWLACVGVYLVVFVSGVAGGASDLLAMGRAVGLTLATAVVGRLALALLSRASQPSPGPLADEDRTLGSLVDLVSSPNLREPQTDVDNPSGRER